MKKIVIASFALVVLLLAGSLAAYAGYGHGPGNGQCPNGTCSGPIIACSGTVETLTGIVAGYNSPGNGMVLDTGTAVETLYGIGPVWYWERNSMDKPEIGETVTVAVETAAIADKTVKVIVSVTMDGQTLSLRDAGTCIPLWRSRR